MNSLIRILLWSVASVAALMLLCIVVFRHEGIKHSAIEWMTVQLEQQTGWHLEMQEVGGFLPFHLTAQHVVLSKDSVIRADRLELALSPLELLRGKVVFAFLDLENVLIKTKETAEPTLVSPSEIQKAIPSFPVALEIERFRFKHVTTEPAILSFPCDLSGSFDFDPKKGRLVGEVGFVCSDTNSIPTMLAFDVALPTSIQPLEGTFEIHSYPFPNFPLTIKGNIQLTAEGIIDLKTIEGSLDHSGDLHHSIALAQGHLSLNPSLEIIESHLDVLMPDLTTLKSTLSLPIAGKIAATCTLNGSILTPTVDAVIKGENTTIGVHTITNLNSKLILSLPKHELEGSWLLSGEVDQIPFTFNTYLSWHFPLNLTFPRVELTLPSTKLLGNLAFSFSNQMWTGELKGEAQDLSPFSRFTPEAIKGRLGIHTTLSYDVSKNTDLSQEEILFQNLDFTIDGSQLHYETWDMESMILKGHLKDPFRSPSGTLAMHLQNTSKGKVVWKELSWDTKVDKQQPTWPFSLSATGNLPSPVQILSSGSWRLTKQALDMHLEMLTGTLGVHPITLAHPTEIRLESDLLELLPTKLTIGSGQIEISAGVADGAVHASLTGDKLPIEAIPSPKLSEWISSGLLNIQASLHGTLKEPLADIQLNLDNVTFPKEKWAQLPPFTGHFEGIIDPSFLVLKGHLEGPGEHPIDIHTQLPLKLSLSPISLSPDPTGILLLHAEAEGEISSLLRLILSDTISITGYAKAAFDVDGTWEKPVLKGRAELTHGTFEDLDTGAVFEQVALVFEGNQQQILLKHLSAVDGRIGTVSGSGAIQLDPANAFPFTCNLHLDKCIIIHLDYALGGATGDITYNGNFKKITINGDLTLDQARITIPEEVQPQMKSVEITYINLPTQEPAPYQLKKKQDKYPLHLNIALHVPEKAYLKGRDLKSEWNGNLKFKGTTTNPLIEGSLNIMSGEYLFNGRSFVSNRGTISFTGDPAKTSLYVIAEQQIEDNRIEIILKGMLSDPIVTFRSNPPMSQREILSWILFNHGISDITPLQGAELSQTVFTLSGGKDSADVLTKLRQSIGIDRVDISSRDTQDSNEVSLRVGKYISKGVFVSVNKSINADTNQVAIEAKLTRQLKIQAEVGDDAEGKMSLKWEKDY